MTAAPDLRDATAAVLAGGLGTRLRSVVADRPKVLAEVAGRPFLGFLLDQLEDAGVRHAVLCTGYLGEQVQDAFGDAHGALRLSYVQENEPLGTAGALRLALPRLGTGAVLALNGDSYCDADLGALWRFHHQHGAAATLQLTPVDDTGRFGRVETDAGGAVTSFTEKGSARGEGWINAGLYVLGRALLESIPAGRAVSLEREILPAWIGRGLVARASEQRFLDIGTPDSYAAAAAFFAAPVVARTKGNAP